MSSDKPGMDASTGSRIARIEAPRRPSQTIGSEIRDLRKAKRLTLAELADRIGRSIGFVSQVERGLSELSVEDLRRIATALEVPLSWFLVNEGALEAEHGYVVRAANRRMIGSTGAGLTEELLSPDLGGAFEVVLSVFEPGAELREPSLRQTEETGYLTAGELDLWIGHRFFRLTAGDSFRIHREPFRWRNPGTEKAVVVWVIAPPVY